MDHRANWGSQSQATLSRQCPSQDSSTRWLSRIWWANYRVKMRMKVSPKSTTFSLLTRPRLQSLATPIWIQLPKRRPSRWSKSLRPKRPARKPPFSIRNHGPRPQSRLARLLTKRLRSRQPRPASTKMLGGNLRKVRLCCKKSSKSRATTLTFSLWWPKSGKVSL